VAARVRVWWQLLKGYKIVYNGVVLNCLSFSPFMVLNARRSFKPC
jgi:hypothetical protein